MMDIALAVRPSAAAAEAEAGLPDADVATRCSTATLSISGMHCSSCSGAVEAELRRLPGVHTVTVSLLTHRAQVRAGR